jgi:acyl-CoA synthetase (AMP-forming)/AMP-acid ligase II
MPLTTVAVDQPGKPAVIATATGQVVTFGELEQLSRGISAVLHARGLRNGDHVAILMDNCPEFLAIAWGAQRTGLYWTPVNWHLSPAEAAYVLADSGAEIVFSSPDTAELALAAAVGCATPPTVLTTGPAPQGSSSLDAALADARVRPEDDEREGSVVLYSSGTTGRPKGIKPKHDFGPFGTAGPSRNRLAQGFGLNDETVYLCPAPLYHAAPIAWSMAVQRAGGTVVLMDRFDPVECLRAIEAHHVTHVQFVPTHLIRLVKLPAALRAAFDVSSLRLVVHAAAPCPAEIKAEVIDWFGPKVTEYYSGSEAIGMTAINAADWLSHRGSVGRAIDGIVHIVGEDGSVLPPDEVGTAYFESERSFRYLNDPAKTAEAMNDRGWYTLGDLGSLDEDGYLYLADRRTDLIISGGVNTYPAEIEAALITHPAVADAGVIGVPDDDLGQAALAVLQLLPGHRPNSRLIEELREHCRERLAGFKQPKTIVFADELPRLPTGKLLRHDLRDRYGG